MSGRAVPLRVKIANGTQGSDTRHHLTIEVVDRHAETVDAWGQATGSA